MKKNNDLGLSWFVFSSLVPSLFQKKRRLEVSKKMFSMSDNDLKCIITRDETWSYVCGPERASEYHAIDKPRIKIVDNRVRVSTFMPAVRNSRTNLPKNTHHNTIARVFQKNSVSSHVVHCIYTITYYSNIQKPKKLDAIEPLSC